MSERLSAENWTQMALRVLAERGIEGVRVERLADALGVTKGSFYWHFEGRRALFDAVLDQWERRATLEVIAAVEQAFADPGDRLRELTRLVFRHGASLDRAVRAWASHDESAGRVVRRVDKRRLEFVADLLRAYGLEPSVAAIRARLLHTALIGEQHTSSRMARERRVQWALHNLELLLRSP